MPAASILIKPASSNCNINCKYCFYKCLSSHREEYTKGFMQEDTLEALIINAINYADGFLSFAFQGGEPLLAGIGFFQKAVMLQKKYNTKGLHIENTIQTNGILINKEWAEFLSKNNFLVGLSLDGPKKIHNQYRKTTNNENTFEDVLHAASLLKQYHVDFNILSVITNETARKASYLYKFYKKQAFNFIQFIPCLDEAGRNNQSLGGFAVNPEEYGRFLCEFFDLWYEDFKAGADMDIRFFSNLAQMAAGYPAEQCGMNGYCQCYFAVEGDGSVYPCDFYCTDKWKLGNVTDGFNNLAASDKAVLFTKYSVCNLPECKECPYFNLCRGGCRRWRESFTDGMPGLNSLCKAYKMFFGYASERIYKLGRLIKEPGYRLD